MSFETEIGAETLFSGLRVFTAVWKVFSICVFKSRTRMFLLCKPHPSCLPIMMFYR